jgi:hypothetical protein
MPAFRSPASFLRTVHKDAAAAAE